MTAPALDLVPVQLGERRSWPGQVNGVHYLMDATIGDIEVVVLLDPVMRVVSVRGGYQAGIADAAGIIRAALNRPYALARLGYRLAEAVPA